MMFWSFVAVQAMAVAVTMSSQHGGVVGDEDALGPFEEEFAAVADCSNPPRRYWVLEEETPSPVPGRERQPTVPESGGGIGGDPDPTSVPSLSPTMQPTGEGEMAPSEQPSGAPTTPWFDFPRDPEDCGTLALQQNDYRGTVSTTIGGFNCQQWNVQHPNRHGETPDRYPGEGLVSNYCRNPDGKSHVWCWIDDPTCEKQWEFCNITACEPDACEDDETGPEGEADDVDVIPCGGVGGGGLWSGIFADPHLSTFDQYTFDCQAGGLFTTMTSLETPAFKVQELFTQIGSGTCSQASVSTGIVIAEVDFPKIQVSTLRDAALVTQGATDEINGCPVDLLLDDQHFFAADGTGIPDLVVNADDDTITIRYPKTFFFSRITVENSQSFGCHFTVEMFKPDSYRNNETIVGLLGTPDYDITNDWMGPDGGNPIGVTLPLPESDWNGEEERAFETAYNYCTTNWCVQSNDNSVFKLPGDQTFDDINECGLGYAHDVEDAVQLALAEPDGDYAALYGPCWWGRQWGGIISCLIDGVCGGVVEAAAAVVAADGIDENGPVSERYNEVCGAYTNRQRSYRGNHATSTNGGDCIAWTQDDKDSYPAYNLTHNFCRNPRPYSKAYCRTSSGLWYCSVPDCNDEGEPLDPAYEIYEGACGAEEDMFDDYRGTESTTENGSTCVAWDTVVTEFSDNMGLGSHNYCRNPGDPARNGGEDVKERTWCYTDESMENWDYCEVPNCCGNHNMADYRGHIAVTEDGAECANWSVHAVGSYGHGKGLGAHHNYCRNPDGDQKAWCYKVGGSWGYCDVPVCPAEGRALGHFPSFVNHENTKEIVKVNNEIEEIL